MREQIFIYLYGKNSLTRLFWLSISVSFFIKFQSIVNMCDYHIVYKFWFIKQLLQSLHDFLS